MKQAIWTFLLFWSIPLPTGADVTVTCVLTSDCMLPCKSTYYDIIHWYKDGKQNSVHTFYKKADHLEYQDADFKGRTALFADQIPQGNASLLLRSIRTADEGRYKCYTATSSQNKEQFVLLKVSLTAPVKWVDLYVTSEGISCSTKAVYPQPKITWYTDGSEVKTDQKVRDDEYLFSVSGVLPQPVEENTTYSCSISLEGESQSYTASLRQDTVDISPGENVTIHCPVYQENSNIILRFGESIILDYTQTSQSPATTKHWREKRLQLARDGTVTIYNLENTEDTGTFTCERLTAQSRQVVNTSVRMTSANGHIGAAVAVAVGVIVIVIAIIAAVIVALLRCKKKGKGNAEGEDHNTCIPLKNEHKSNSNTNE